MVSLSLLLAAGTWLLWLRGRRSAEVRVTCHEDPAAAVSYFRSRVSGLEYHPSPWLPHGLLQSAFAEVPTSYEITYSTEEVFMPSISFATPEEKTRCCPDNVPEGTVELDWFRRGNGGPVVVICPGLTGGSDPPYVHRICWELAAAPEAFRPVVFVPRTRGTKGARKPDTPFFYSCGYTHDLRRAVLHIKEKEPGAQVFGLAFSMGANYLAKYMGEEGESCPLDGACLLAPPVDCPELMRNLRSSFFGRYVIDPFLTAALQKVRGHLDHLLHPHDPHPLLPPGVDLEKTKKAKTIRDYDDVFTAPMMQCSDAFDYYDQSSCMHVLHQIDRPLMMMHAENDPVVPARCLPTHLVSGNPNLISLITSSGGHSMGWPVGLSMKNWSSDLSLEFFRAIRKHQ